MARSLPASCGGKKVQHLWISIRVVDASHQLKLKPSKEMLLYTTDLLQRMWSYLRHIDFFMSSKTKFFYEVDVKQFEKQVTPNPDLIIKLSSIEGYPHDQPKVPEMTRAGRDDKRSVLES
jgi:hypothetical protein